MRSPISRVRCATDCETAPKTPNAASNREAAANPVTIDLKVKSGDVSIAELARLASAFGTG